ncbi:MAG TPA: NB-ARC domain-containing protein [Chloroflexia bacterium]
MQEQLPIIAFDRADTPNELAAKLRMRVFSSQQRASRYFGVAHTTISRYERVDPNPWNSPGVTPPLGYLAELIRLAEEKLTQSSTDNNSLEEFRQRELELLNKLLARYSPIYNYRAHLRDWDEVTQLAATYSSKRRSHVKSKNSTTAAGPSNLAGKFNLVPSLPPQGVFGREQILTRIEEMLTMKTAGTSEASPVALRGFGGIGKTTIAISVGRRSTIAALFPDGVLWTELGPNPFIRHLLTIWGHALNVDLGPERDHATCEAKIRDALFQRRMLLIVDDIWDPNHGRHFLLGGPNCGMLLTTRESKIAYDLTTPDRTLNVGLLDLKASLQMLQEMAPQAVAFDRKAAERLCIKLDGLPLAIKLAGQLLAVEADVPLRMRKLVDELIERREARLELTQSERRLGLSEEQLPSLQAILGMSVERLSAIDKNRFATLAVFGSEPLTWEILASAAVWECSVEEAEATMSRLIQRALVEVRPDGRYWMNGLLADYAAELLAARVL